MPQAEAARGERWAQHTTVRPRRVRARVVGVGLAGVPARPPSRGQRRLSLLVGISVHRLSHELDCRELEVVWGIDQRRHTAGGEAHGVTGKADGF